MIDTVTLVNALVEQGDRDEAGGIQYITLIAESVPSAANVKDYARIVKDKAILRRLIDVCEDISRDAYEESSPVRTIIDSAEQKIFDIANNNDVKEFRHIRDVLQNVYRDIEATVEAKGETLLTEVPLRDQIIAFGKNWYTTVADTALITKEDAAVAHTAAFYLNVTYSNGATRVIPVNATEENSRTLLFVASAALADTEAEYSPTLSETLRDLIS